MSQKYKIIFGVMILITAVSVITAFNLNRKLSALKNAPAEAAATSAAEVQKIVAEVGKHLVLPEGEVPTMAVVSDLSKLKDQPFFERAALGDIVLIYATTRRAVLWRPSAQKIIEVSAINLPSPVVQTPASVSSSTKKTR